jgi:mannose-6-phosphate isomerase-like protein (cupin superfamily)
MSLEHSIRPWGEYTVILDTQKCKVKTITVNPGMRLSLQSHQHREEHWVIVSGTGEAITQAMSLGVAGSREPEPIRTRAIQAGDYVHIPKGIRHRIANTGTTPLVFIETQLGTLLDENDIIRYQDDFGRV